jgi:A/G-specific adenine glycosylase
MEQIQKMSYFVHHLLDWFSQYQRDLPWRRNKNPYYIWVSEIMLQQTRVDTVIPYFHRFIEKFPTIEALAEAPEEEVLKCWEGLGYYSRARNLHTAVREVKERYGSVVPREKREISTLKGVGPYTAGAILSIAYNKPEPALDGNVMRVLSRYFLIKEDIMKGSTRVYMENLIRELIPHDAAGDFNQALMELGAMVCTPKSPHCLTCPVMEHCEGRIEGMELSLPVKKKAKPPRVEQRIVSLIEGSGKYKGKLLIRQRPQEGLLARMWELPHVDVQGASLNWKGSDEQNMDYIRERLAGDDGLHLEPEEFFMNTDHTFSHIHWDMKVYRCKSENEIMKEGSESDERVKYRWISLDEREQYAFPNVFLRIMQQYEKVQQ